MENSGLKLKKVVHKPYVQDQVMLLPVDLQSMIPEDHLVYVIDRVVEGISMEDLNQCYPGGGGSTYHPKMMIKVWIYGYCERALVLNSSQVQSRIDQLNAELKTESDKERFYSSRYRQSLHREWLAGHRAQFTQGVLC